MIGLAASDHHARERSTVPRSVLPGALPAFAGMSSSKSPSSAHSPRSSNSALRADLPNGPPRPRPVSRQRRWTTSTPSAVTRRRGQGVRRYARARHRRLERASPGYAKNGLTGVAMEMVVQMQDEDGDSDTETSYLYVKRKLLKSSRTNMTSSPSSEAMASLSKETGTSIKESPTVGAEAESQESCESTYSNVQSSLSHGSELDTAGSPFRTPPPPAELCPRRSYWRPTRQC